MKKAKIGNLFLGLLIWLFIGNVANNFFRYTQIYQLFMPKWVSRVVYMSEYDRFENKWAQEVKLEKFPKPIPEVH